MKRVFVNLDKCLGCNGCMIACAVEQSSAGDLFKAISEMPLPVSRIEVKTVDEGGSFPLQCRHCEEPYCIDACIAGAIRKDPETGLVLSDEEKCVGCWMCVMTCPFGVIRVSLLPDKKGKIAVKCDLCQDRKIPACVEACHTGALLFCEVEQFISLVSKSKGDRDVLLNSR
ncbi:MAG: 4Fe-4S dicluster domain-containing protein [Spirochaetes bacterium]|nr:4Fe-4S dicluster domain-containing protein [Spirochaetota bacterium]